MKKYFLFAATILIILMTTAQPSKAAPVITGDLNEDGFVTSDDAIYLLMHSQFPTDERYKLNQELKFQKGSEVSSDDAIYLLMFTQFPDDYPIDGSLKMMKMKYLSIGVYTNADAESDTKGTLTYNTTYTVTKQTVSGAWSYVREMAGWVPTKALVSEETVLPEEYTYAREYICLGSIGDTVKEVQEAMRLLGYTDADGDELYVDGIFGGDTDYAVKAFQSDYDLGPDGCLSASGITWGKIDSIKNAGTRGVTITSSGKMDMLVHTTPAGRTYLRDSKTWVNTSALTDRVSLSPYVNNEYTTYTVKKVQGLLNSIGYRGSNNEKLDEDGFYDADFYEALYNFQYDYDLGPDGVMGYRGSTWTCIESILGRSTYSIAVKAGGNIYKYHDTSSGVLANVTSITKYTVLHEVGGWTYLSDIGGWVLESDIESVYVDYPSLYSGMTSTYKTQMMPYISMLNRFLNQLGYSAEKTNIAYWTDSTYSAVKAFQSDYNLGADGYVGVGTWNALIKRVMKNDTTSDATFEQYLSDQGFPESYKVYLRRLHKQHPNWVFVAEKTAKSWSTFVSYQFSHTSSQPAALMTKTWADCLKCKDSITYKDGTYTTYDGGAWVVPNEATIQYYMDPRNFLDEKNAFQFFDLSYNSIYTEEFISSIASYLGMNYMTREYTHADGTTINYPKVILEYCVKYNYSPVAFISSVKQELGTSPEAAMISGTFSEYEGYYNYVNYGAYQDGTMGPKERGMWAAKNKVWDTREKAIEGAIYLFANYYVKTGQETIYYKKFNAKSSTNYANHQFMSNISGAYSEGFNTGVALINKLSNEEIVFRIPVYEGMQDTNYLLPNR